MARHEDLEQELQSSYHRRAKEIKAGLSTAAGLESDVLLAALKRSPATAPLAAARAQELLADLLPAHYAHNSTGHCGRSAAEAEAAHEEAALVKQQLRHAQQAARTALERLEAESLQRQRVEMKLSAVQQRADQAARELQEAHIARMAAENRVAELQLRQNTASTSASQQVARLEAARQSSQAQLEESSAKLRALESTHQQHLSDCSARQAAVAEREAALEQQCRQARNDASVARAEAETHRQAAAVAQARSQGLEETSSGLKARADAAAGHIAELERQLARAESERRDAREKYVALVRRFEAQQSHEEATRLGMQEAVRDVEALSWQRDELAARLAETKQAGCRAGRCAQAAREEVEKLRREACLHNTALCDARSTIAGLEAQVVDAKRRAELVEEELAKRKSSREDMRAQLEREAEAGLKLQLQQKDFEWRQKYQELELRVRHLSSNDVVANPSDYITKAEHARILDSRLASKDYDATGEMARRVGSIEREAALRLAARDAELQAAAATQLRKVQEEHDIEMKRRTVEVERAMSELHRVQREAADAREEAESARKNLQRLKEDLTRSQEAREEATEQLEEATRQLHHLQHQLSASEAQGVIRERTHLQEETAQLRRELADERSEAADVAAAAAAELRAAKKKHEIALQALGEKVEQAEHARDAAQQRVREAAQAAKVFENEAAEAGSRLRDAQAAAERALAETRQLEERAAEARAESVRLKEQVREQTAAAEAAVRAARAEKDRLLALHKRRVSRVASQVSKQVLQLRSQQALLRTAFEGELQRAAADCANGVEAMQARWRQVLLTLRSDAVAAGQAHKDMLAAARREDAERFSQTLAEARAAAAVHEEAVVAEAQRETRSALESLAAAQADGRQLQQCLGLLVGGLAPLISLDNSTQHALTSCESADSFSLYLQQLLQQVRTWADEQALQRVLVPIERALPAVQQPRRASVRASFMAASADALGLDKGSLDRRVAQAVAACGACAARIKDLEAAVKLGEEGVEQARVEAGEKAVEAREAAVRPLRAELGRMRVALTDLQSAYASDIAQIKEAAEGHLSSMRREAQDSISQLQSNTTNLQAQLAAELERADGLREDVARLRAQAIAMPRSRKDGDWREGNSGADSPQRSNVAGLQAHFSALSSGSPSRASPARHSGN